jgi:hypothetical protein
MSMFVKAFSPIYRHPAATQESTRVAGPPTSLPMKWKAWESRCGQEHPLSPHHSLYSPIGTSCQHQYDSVDCLSSSGRSNATWVVSENHRAAHATFREPLARSKANPTNCRRFR